MHILNMRVASEYESAAFCTGKLFPASVGTASVLKTVRLGLKQGGSNMGFFSC